MKTALEVRTMYEQMMPPGFDKALPGSLANTFVEMVVSQYMDLQQQLEDLRALMLQPQACVAGYSPADVEASHRAFDAATKLKDWRMPIIASGAEYEYQLKPIPEPVLAADDECKHGYDPECCTQCTAYTPLLLGLSAQMDAIEDKEYNKALDVLGLGPFKDCQDCVFVVTRATMSLGVDADGVDHPKSPMLCARHSGPATMDVYDGRSSR